MILYITNDFILTYIFKYVSLKVYPITSKNTCNVKNKAYRAKKIK